MSAQPTHASEFAEFMQTFTEASARLQETHLALSSQVERLQAELAEANERLRRSRSLAALGEMAAGIAHEIRNPLGAIRLNAELLAEDVAGQVESSASVDKIRRASERLERIVTDVLRFARDTRVHASATNAADIFEVAASDCEGLLESERVELRLDIQGECRLQADGALVAQAISNLARNAIEAMRGSTERVLTLGAREARLRTPDGARRDFIVLFVEDSGPGIPLAARERIFNPFFTTREEGTGLGLAIVHRIVDAHGGMTSCGDAQHRASGARLELSLPLTPRQFNDAEGVSLGDAVRRRIGGNSLNQHTNQNTNQHTVQHTVQAHAG